MAKRIVRTNQQPGFVSTEFHLGANEVLVLPVRRSVSKNGDSTIAVMATAGTKLSYTIEPHDQIAMAFKGLNAEGHAFLNSITGDYPATANPASWARVWQADTTIAAGTIHEHKNHATCLRITAPAGGGFVVLFGDY